MAEFGIGDVVRANASSLDCRPQFIRGTIKGVWASTYELTGDDGNTVYVWQDGAELLRDGAHIVASTKHGPSRQPYIHPSREAAVEEAERLARQHPGDEFGVYERVTARVADVVVREVA